MSNERERDPIERKEEGRLRSSSEASEGSGGEADQAWFDESWTRVHPLSPFVRGWLTVVAVPIAIFGYNWQMWRDLWDLYRSGELMENVEQNPLPYVFGSGGALLLIVVIFVSFVLSWWFTRYKITEEHVMVKSGIFVRQHRQARIDRVQAVDLRQPLLARFTGLAELKFEVAEGDGTAATLAFLKKSQAEDLRAEIMDRASGRDEFPAAQQDLSGEAGHSVGEPGAYEPGSYEPGAYEHGAVDDGAGGDGAGEYAAAQDGAGPGLATQDLAAQYGGVQDGGVKGGPASSAAAFDGRQITRVPTGRLIGSVLTGAGSLLMLAMFALAIVGIVIGILMTNDGSLSAVVTEVREDFSFSGLLSLGPALLPGIIALLAVYYQGFSKGYGFTATMTDAGLRLKYGLLETTTQTIPPGRVQAIQVQQGLPWRPFGWYKMMITVAGYGISGQRNVLLPVGRFEDVMAVTAEMFPDLQVENPEELFRHGVTGRGTAGGFTEVPRRARIFDPLVRRRRGFLATPSALMIRDGVTFRILSMVPHERIQSLRLTQGPFKRMFRLANLRVHLPGGPIIAVTANQDLDAAKELFEQESAYAAFARRYSDRNRWMLPEELREFEKKVEEVAEAQR